MRKILVIGIGAGNPDYITIQAINALNQVDVFFVMDKGAEKDKLAALRREICRRFINNDNYRVVEATSPPRLPDPPDYRSAVADLNREKTMLFQQLIMNEMADGDCGAFLVWGDPSLYDSTIRILKAVLAAEQQRTGNQSIAFEVIPGITSVQALAAKHKTTLNQIGEPFEITTGRRLAQSSPATSFPDTSFPDTLASVAVMLDANASFKQFVDQDIDIFWGAYVGMPDEILLAGKLSDVAADIERLRTEARAANGWIMDTYIMHRAQAGQGDG